MKEALIFVVLFTILLNTFGQSPQECFNIYKVKADACLSDKDSLNCRKYLEKAVELNKQINSWDLVAISYCYFALGERVKAFEYLRIAVSRGATVAKFPGESGSIYLGIGSIYAKDSLNLTSFLSDYPKLRATFISNMNIELTLKITRMLERDQYSRIYCKKGLGGYQTADSLNMIEMRAILKKYKFPSVAQIGEDGMSDFFIVYLHLTTEDKYWEEFLPNLLVALEEGKVRGMEYATLVDRRLVFGNKTQYYGMFSENKKISPVQDIANVDLYRAKLGILPLQYYAPKIRCSAPDNYVYKSIVNQFVECDK